MIGYKLACKYYGIIPYNKEEEENLSDDEKLIRQCKIDIINACNEMRESLEQLGNRAKRAPETGDFNIQEHAELMKNWRVAVRKAKALTEEAATYAII